MTIRFKPFIMAPSQVSNLNGDDPASTWITKPGEHAVGVVTTITLVTIYSRKRRLLRSRSLITC
ncbi:MAG: hypothetical protein RLZZ422_1157 [Pseudomonadota bacterium]